MRSIICSCAIGILLCFDWTVGSARGQSAEPSLSDTRLSIHTLVREDIFAGWRTSNMKRLARGEKNIDLLLEQRPQEKADLLAWKGGAALFRSILAHESGDDDAFQEHFQKTREHFAEARKLGPKNVGTAAVVGGSYVMFADRLPEKHRAKAWSEAYDNYMVLWKLQAQAIDKMPVHISGELLAGLAQSAQRTGRQEEMDRYLDKIIEVLPDTGYAKEANRWKKDPQLAAVNNISCKSCHTPGRLSARIRELNSDDR